MSTVTSDLSRATTVKEYLQQRMGVIVEGPSTSSGLMPLIGMSALIAGGLALAAYTGGGGEKFNAKAGGFKKDPTLTPKFKRKGGGQVIVYKSVDGEYAVVPPDRRESATYYTSDREDARVTALAIALEKQGGVEGNWLAWGRGELIEAARGSGRYRVSKSGDEAVEAAFTVGWNHGYDAGYKGKPGGGADLSKAGRILEGAPKKVAKSYTDGWNEGHSVSFAGDGGWYGTARLGNLNLLPPVTDKYHDVWVPEGTLGGSIMLSSEPHDVVVYSTPDYEAPKGTLSLMLADGSGEPIFTDRKLVKWEGDVRSDGKEWAALTKTWIDDTMGSLMRTGQYYDNRVFRQGKSAAHRLKVARAFALGSMKQSGKSYPVTVVGDEVHVDMSGWNAGGFGPWFKKLMSDEEVIVDDWRHPRPQPYRMQLLGGGRDSVGRVAEPHRGCAAGGGPWQPPSAKPEMFDATDWNRKMKVGSHVIYKMEHSTGYDEYAVVPPHGEEAGVYYTEDIHDAFGTATAMERSANLAEEG